MSALPEPNCRKIGNKLHVSLMLKVPIDIEVELGMSPTSHQVEDEFVSHTENLKPAVVMSEVSQVEFEEQIRVLSNQIVTEFFQVNEAFSTFEETQDEDNLVNQESTPTPDSSSVDVFLLEEDTQTPEKQKRRFIDSLNDGLTLTVNVVGTALFLGKLANYSWE